MRRAAAGFTLIEMVFVLGIVAILAMMTLPLYIDRNVQLQVKEGIAFAEFMQRGVSTAYAATGVLPKDNAAAGLPAPEKVIGNYIVSGTVTDGVLTLVFGNLAVSNIRGKKVTLRPAYVADTPQVPVSWICASAAPADVTGNWTMASRGLATSK